MFRQKPSPEFTKRVDVDLQGNKSGTGSSTILDSRGGCEQYLWGARRSIRLASPDKGYWDQKGKKRGDQRTGNPVAPKLEPEIRTQPTLNFNSNKKKWETSVGGGKGVI